MEKYSLILKKRLVKGIFKSESCSLVSTAYEYVDGEWEEIEEISESDILKYMCK